MENISLHCRFKIVHIKELTNSSDICLDCIKHALKGIILFYFLFIYMYIYIYKEFQLMTFVPNGCTIFTQVAELCILFGVLNFYIYNLFKFFALLMMQNAFVQNLHLNVCMGFYAWDLGIRLINLYNIQQ